MFKPESYFNLLCVPPHRLRRLVIRAGGVIKFNTAQFSKYPTTTTRVISVTQGQPRAPLSAFSHSTSAHRQKHSSCTSAYISCADSQMHRPWGWHQDPVCPHFLAAWNTLGSSSSSCTWAAAQIGMCAPLMKLAASDARKRIGPASMQRYQETLPVLRLSLWRCWDSTFQDSLNDLLALSRHSFLLEHAFERLQKMYSAAYTGTGLRA